MEAAATYGKKRKCKEKGRPLLVPFRAGLRMRVMRNLLHIPAGIVAACFAVMCFLVALAASAVPTVPHTLGTVTASAANDAPRWRPVRTEIPARPVFGTFGPAVAVTEGRLWIGPARDTDVGDGPPQVTAFGIRAGFGLPSFDPVMVEHPAAARNAGFGLALAAAQGICVVGSPHAGCRERGCDSGQVHLVAHDHDGSWSVDEVTCPDAIPASEFGAAVATDGRTIVIGSPRADSPDRDGGAVDIFEVGPAPAYGVTFVTRLRPPSPRASARFGAAVAVSADWIAIGEPGAGETYPRPGIVHLVHRSADGWKIESSLRAPAGAVGWFGTSVALAGCELLIGAPVARAVGSTVSCGAAVHCSLKDGQWLTRRVIVAPGGRAGDAFGMAVALGNGWAAIGAPGTDGSATDRSDSEDIGAAWAVELRSLAMERLLARTPRAGDGFGAGLAFGSAHGSTRTGPRYFLAVGHRQDQERPLEAGSVDLYGYDGPMPALVAVSVGPQSVGEQSRSASSMASAAEASVTAAGTQPSEAARSTASRP
jgi:hypothetical protein